MAPLVKSRDKGDLGYWTTLPWGIHEDRDTISDVGGVYGEYGEIKGFRGIRGIRYVCGWAIGRWTDWVHGGMG